MQTCAVLVNYKNAALTVRCLHALERGTVKPDLVYVIDNATCEESQKIFQGETFSIPVNFIWNKHNVGFAAANNQGVRAAQAEGFDGYVWLINNDTEPKETALEKLLQKAKESGAGITGSLIVDEKSNYIGGAGTTHAKLASVGRPQAPHGSDVPHFDYIEGADYCYRAKKAGFSLAWATESIVSHRIGSSTGSENAKGCVPFFIDCLMIRNRIHFAKRNGFPAVGIWAGFLISLAIRIKRRQLNRVLKIIEITLSTKRLKKFIESNGGYYEIHD